MKADDRPSPPASLGRLTVLDCLPADSVILFHPHQTPSLPPLCPTNPTRDTHSRSEVDVGARGCVNVEGDRKPAEP